MNPFKKPEVVEKIVYRVVELPESRTHLKGGEKETREMIATLSSNPAFTALTQRLGTMNAALRSRLVGEHHADMRAVDFLQAGVYWSNWLQMEVQRATIKMPERSADAMQDELEAFQAIDSAIERVG
jgi:hypothetical protein